MDPSMHRGHSTEQRGPRQRPRRRPRVSQGHTSLRKRSSGRRSQPHIAHIHNIIIADPRPSMHSEREKRSDVQLIKLVHFEFEKTIDNSNDDSTADMPI